MDEVRNPQGQDKREERISPSRREVLAAGFGGALLLGASPPAQETPRPASPAPEGGRTMLTRPIPRTGEKLPAIGLGTWQTFNVGTDAKERAPLKDVLKRFLEAGGRVIDSSPMYDRAETVVGDLLEELGQSRTPFLASKVWTMGRVEGEQQMRTSVQRMGRGRMDLMQVHNLVDVQTHLATLRQWQEAGRIRYIGVTHYLPSSFEKLEKLIREETLDFVQLPYSLTQREAEARLLPACAERGVAVVVMSPFEQGALFQQVRGKALPPWAAEFDCTSWAQFFLKFILGHPAVTCPIPATSNPKHLEDNLKAGFGRLPDEKTRAKMVKHLGL
ncbi:aldo/keto reductase [Hyalangium rubrum]|uniref:Aldo/keto reductase n=1 Tax=Hyalangium rubrum TaxID=3103134 RepID=A0ABU5GZX3_9BACT|nr:aldo/keto reductase [Hyalangium sp. s54d21]MDY7226078.1 aldo/keto reductase [Hyalangium sp. s54d21]